MCPLKITRCKTPTTVYTSVTRAMPLYERLGCACSPMRPMHLKLGVGVDVECNHQPMEGGKGERANGCVQEADVCQCGPSSSALVAARRRTFGGYTPGRAISRFVPTSLPLRLAVRLGIRRRTYLNSAWPRLGDRMRTLGGMIPAPHTKKGLPTGPVALRPRRPAASAFHLRTARSLDRTAFRLCCSPLYHGALSSNMAWGPFRRESMDAGQGPARVPLDRLTRLPKVRALLTRLDQLPRVKEDDGAGQQRRLTGREVEENALQKCWRRHEAVGVPTRPAPADALRSASLQSSYDRCARVTAEYAKTFYLGTSLMTPEKARATWAIYVWCRRTDELVDGPNAPRITPQALDRWEERLEALFEGRPVDMLDAALTDTIDRFPIDIQPFRDMIGGMRMDLVKSRYQTFDELYEYCYRVAGAVGLMTAPVMGIDPKYGGPLEPVYRASLALGTANQLTNILRDVGEDSLQRNRIYVPTEELDQFGIPEQELLRGGLFASTNGRVDDRWRAFMKFQIKRAREFFLTAEEGVHALDADARWPVWSALNLYRQILDAIEENDYNNFTQRAYVTRWKKLLALPVSYGQAKFPKKAPFGHAPPRPRYQEG
ncbi:unnamed protein product [Ostreobium quekettii]|uniref:15-cis-phytoene synthase n=1 Tax=Ostreobium quekettii TaxID=121088 RepID=A0A8S1JAX0_9CHLO|nr:unnamed protein product [Ostreobium quekettii]